MWPEFGQTVDARIIPRIWRIWMRTFPVFLGVSKNYCVSPSDGGGSSTRRCAFPTSR